MRDQRLRRSQPLGDRLAHRDRAGSLHSPPACRTAAHRAAARCREWRRRTARRRARGAAGFAAHAGFGRRFDIGFDDASARAGAGKRGKVDAGIVRRSAAPAARRRCGRRRMCAAGARGGCGLRRRRSRCAPVAAGAERCRLRRGGRFGSLRRLAFRADGVLDRGHRRRRSIGGVGGASRPRRAARRWAR